MDEKIIVNQTQYEDPNSEYVFICEHSQEYYSQFSEQLKTNPVHKNEELFYRQQLVEKENQAKSALKTSKASFIMGIIYCAIPLLVLIFLLFLGQYINPVSALVCLVLYVISGFFFLPTLITAIISLVKSKHCKQKYKSKVKTKSICALLLLLINFIFSIVIFTGAMYKYKDFIFEAANNTSYYQQYDENGKYNINDPHYKYPNFRKEYN